MLTTVSFPLLKSAVMEKEGLCASNCVLSMKQRVVKTPGSWSDVLLLMSVMNRFPKLWAYINDIWERCWSCPSSQSWLISVESLILFDCFVLWIFFSLCIVDFLKNAMVRFYFQVLFPVRVLVSWIQTACQARGGYVLSNHKPDCAIVSGCLCMWLPVQCQYVSVHHNPLFCLFPLFFGSYLLFFHTCFSRIHQWLFSRCLTHSFLWVCLWEWANHQNIFPSAGWCDVMVDPYNDGFAHCFIMIGSFGLTCFATAEKPLSHVSWIHPV